MEEAAIVTAGGARPRKVDAGRGVAWWSESWALFLRNPVMWIIFGVILIVGSIVLGWIPVVGGIVLALLVQVIVGGWLLAVRKLESGGTLEVGDLFLGFRDGLNPLVVLGVLTLVASVVIVLVMGVMGAGAAFGMAGSSGGMESLMRGAAVGMMAAIAGLALAFLAGMAFWFAPALIVFAGLPPVEALKVGWSAAWSNVPAMVVYGLIWIVAGIVASIPFGLGWFVLLPLTVLGLYCSYRDIFETASERPPGAV